MPPPDAPPDPRRGPDDRLSIGRFARLSGLSAKALRYYDHVGLLRPRHTDPTTGYRWYASGQVRQAHLVELLRGLGVPVQDMLPLVRDLDEGRLAELYARFASRAERDLLLARTRLRALRRLQAQPLPDGPHEVHEEERPRAAFAHVRYRTDVAAAEDDREAAFRRVRDALARARVLPVGPPLCAYWYGTAPRGAGMQWVCAGYEVPAPMPAPPGVEVGVTPSGRAVRVRHVGPYEYTKFVFDALHDRVRHDRNTPVDRATLEVYHTGPWDTVEARGYCTDVVWFVRLDDAGCLAYS